MNIKKSLFLNIILIFSSRIFGMEIDQDEIENMVFNLCDIIKNNTIDHSKKVEAVKILINRGVNLGLPIEHEPTVLMIASFHGYMDIVKLLIKAKVNLDAQNVLTGKSVLCWMSKLGRLGIVKMLIESGANLDLQDKSGRTALMESLLFGHFEISKLLIDSKADLDLPDNQGKTARNHIKHMKIFDQDNYGKIFYTK